MSRELIALGTASQAPTRHRNHNGYLLRWDGRGFLFDPGEGTQRQMIFAGVSASAITAICITHFHGDHCLGLAGIVQRLSLDGVTHDVPAHFPGSGQVFYERLRHASIFLDRSPVRAQPFTLPGVVWEDAGLRLEVARLDHTVEAWGYRVQEPDGRTMLPEALEARGIRGPAIGALIREGRATVDGAVVQIEDVSVPKRGQSFALVMDTRPCDGALELARGVDMLVCESTYLHVDRAHARRNGHMTAHQAAELAVRAGARSLVLTHFSQRYPRTEPFVAEASRVFPGAIAARDGMSIPIPPRAP